MNVQFPLNAYVGPSSVRPFASDFFFSVLKFVPVSHVDRIDDAVDRRRLIRTSITQSFRADSTTDKPGQVRHTRGRACRICRQLSEWRFRRRLENDNPFAGTRLRRTRVFRRWIESTSISFPESERRTAMFFFFFFRKTIFPERFCRFRSKISRITACVRRRFNGNGGEIFSYILLYYFAQNRFSEHDGHVAKRVKP